MAERVAARQQHFTAGDATALPEIVADPARLKQILSRCCRTPPSSPRAAARSR